MAYFIATLHLLTFGLGFGACWARAIALQKVKSAADLKPVFLADNFWGLAALLWIATGLWRTFGGLEKGTDYYTHNTAFLIKMGLFALVFALELKPMITLIRWRIREKKGETIDFTSAPALARISWIELILLVPIVAMATSIARGILY